MKIFVSSLFLWVDNLGMVRWGPVAQSRQWGCHPGLSSSGFDLMAQLGRMLLGCWSEGLRASVGPGSQDGNLFQHRRQAKRTKEKEWRREGSHSFQSLTKGVTHHRFEAIVFFRIQWLPGASIMRKEYWKRWGPWGRFEVAEHRSGSLFDCDYYDS